MWQVSFRVVLLLLCASCASTTASRGRLIRANPIHVQKRTEEIQPQVGASKVMKVVSPKVPAAVTPGSIVQKANEDAKRDPQSDAFFNSSMLFDWEPNSLYQIYTSPLRITDISFEPAERIVSLSGGDTTRWSVAQTSSGSGASLINHVIVKPLRAQLQTNLVIMTDRRTYHLEMHSLSDGNYMASVGWNYPTPLVAESVKEEEEYELNPLAHASASQLDFGYHFVATSRPSWMPTRVFDDGQKTFIEFPRNAKSREMPGLFVLSKSGASEITNYRVVGDFYIIDRLVDVLELRLGDLSPEIVGIERL